MTISETLQEIFELESRAALAVDARDALKVCLLASAIATAYEQLADQLRNELQTIGVV
jgi:hypothetical protein